MNRSTVPVISSCDISKRFGGIVALSGVSLDIYPGELHAICGENGAGKTTLMKVLSGVITEYEGELLLRGQKVRFTDVRDAQRSGISIIHQELNLVDELSVAANIFLGREMRNCRGLLDEVRMEAAAAALLATLDPSVQPQQRVGDLRLGDRQLLEITKALSLESEILVMDEPTSALSQVEVERLFRTIEQLRKRGVTIVYISHRMEELFRLADRISVMRDGRLIATVDRDDSSPQEITRYMVGRELDKVFREKREPGPVVLEVKHLSLRWPGHPREWRLRDVSFPLRRGEILGIAGLMGAGRTELLECLFGCSVLPPAGRVLLNGKSTCFRHPAEAQRSGLAFVTEDRKKLGLFTQMSVAENMTITALRQLSARGFLDLPRERAVAAETVRNLGIKTPTTEAQITSLSGGNQQKTLLGRALMTRPQVLLLDDPTRGIDIAAKAELYRLMDRLCREGLGIILTSSELPELLQMCDRILVLCEGRVTGIFAREEASEEKILERMMATNLHFYH